MTPTIRIRDEAEAEIQEAYAWYEERLSGLGGEFIQAVEDCLNRIAENPSAYPVVYKNVHRVLTRRFPYGIFYLVEGKNITVISCFHGSRDPKRWRRRV